MIDKHQKLAHTKRARDLTLVDRQQLLNQCEWAENLNETSRNRLTQNSDALDFRRRRFIYKAGEAADSLFTIVQGRVKFCRLEQNSDREAVIDILSMGSLFGESALYSAAGLRENCAVAYEQTLLLKIPVGAFQESMAEDQRLHNYMFRLIGQRLENAERRLADFALNAIPQRLGRMLADFSERYGVVEDGGVLIDLPLPHREIASIVGSTRESVTVRLNAMRREGTIDFVNRRILVKRPAALTVL